MIGENIKKLKKNVTNTKMAFETIEKTVYCYFVI